MIQLKFGIIVLKLIPSPAYSYIGKLSCTSSFQRHGVSHIFLFDSPLLARSFFYHFKFILPGVGAPLAISISNMEILMIRIRPDLFKKSLFHAWHDYPSCY